MKTGLAARLERLERLRHEKHPPQFLIVGTKEELDAFGLAEDDPRTIILTGVPRASVPPTAEVGGVIALPSAEAIIE